MSNKEKAWDPNSAEYAETIAAYETLLNQPSEPKDESYRARNEFSALSLTESAAPAEVKEVFLDFGFCPVVRERSHIEALGIDIVSETWADPTGGTTVEISIGNPKIFVSTYFVDGEVIAVWPSDSPLVGTKTGRRQVEAGSGDLRQDIELVLRLRDEHGSPTLKFVDIATARLREEYHWRFIHVDPVTAAMANPDMEAIEASLRHFRKLSLKLVGGAILVVVLVAFVVTQFWGVYWIFLIGCATVLVLLLGYFYRVWAKPIKPEPPSREDLENALKIMEQMEKDRKN